MSREGPPNDEPQPDRPAAQMRQRRIWSDRLNKFGWDMGQIAKLKMLDRYDKRYENSSVKDFFRKYDGLLEQALRDEKSGKGVAATDAEFLQGGGACYRQVETLYDAIKTSLPPDQFREFEQGGTEGLEE